MRPALAMFGLGLTSVGGAIGAFLGGSAGALLGAVAGLLFTWALAKRAFFEAISGAVKGAVFLFLVGPGIDWCLQGVPLSTHAATALAAGSLLGAALGIRNARRRKPTSAPDAEPNPASTPNS